MTTLADVLTQQLGTPEQLGPPPPRAVALIDDAGVARELRQRFPRLVIVASKAPKRRARSSTPGVSVVARIEALPVARHSLDALIVYSSPAELPERLSELRDRLRAGARLLLIGKRRGPWRKDTTLLGDLLNAGFASIGQRQIGRFTVTSSARPDLPAEVEP